MTRSLTQRLAQLATAGAVSAFAATLARHHPDPSTAAESGFLAWLAGCTFGALAISRHSGWAVVPGGLLLTIVLGLPAADGTRGALALLVLVATVAAFGWRLIQREGPTTMADYAALTLAWQSLLRSDRLLAGDPTPQSLVWLVALPLAAALAAWWFGRRRGVAAALVLLAAAGLVTPGFGVVPVAVLVIVAALCGQDGRSWQAAGVASAAAIVAVGRLPDAAPALLVLAAAVALRGTRFGAWLPWLAALAWSLAGGIAGGGAIGWLLLALPVVLVAPAAARPLALAAVALALGYHPELPPALLAPAFVLAALTVPPAAARGRLADQAQAHWSLLFLSAVALRAAYPWLRDPLVRGSAADLLTAGLATCGLPLALLALLAASLACAAALGRAVPRWCAVLGLLALVALAAARHRAPLVADAVLLTPERRSWQLAAGELRNRGPVRELVIDSFLSRAESLAPGQPVAHVILRIDGEDRRLTLHNGRETADWAAGRLALEAAPEPWLHWHAGDRSLAQRYRARWRLDPLSKIDGITLMRDSALPTEVAVAIIAAEAR